MSDDFHPLWLSDAIATSDRVSLRWSDCGLPEAVEQMLVAIGQISESVTGIIGVLEADEVLVSVNNQGTFDYTGLNPETRRQLFQACRHLSSYAAEKMAEVAGIKFGQGAT